MVVASDRWQIEGQASLDKSTPAARRGRKARSLAPHNVVRSSGCRRCPPGSSAS